MDHLGDDMQAGVASDGDTRFRNKKSKTWDGYKPVVVNGVIQRAECRYCHVRFSCNGGHLWRHLKNCRAKEGLGLSQQQPDEDLRYVLVSEIDPLEQIVPDSLDDVNLVSHSENSKLKSEVWKDFIPIYVEGKIQAADCVHCHKRLSADKGRRHLTRHTLGCLAQSGMSITREKAGHDKNNSTKPSSNLQRSQEEIGVLFQSSIPSLKSRIQDDVSCALTNGQVEITEHANKFLKGSSCDRTPVDQHILSSPPRDKMQSMEQNISSAQTAPDLCRNFDQETSYQELTRMIILHGFPLSIVENEEMRSFAKSLNPEFNMASSIDIEEYSAILFQKEKADLKKKIALSSHRVSLSVCLWTPHGSEASVQYLCLAVHFVDSDWKLQRRIIKLGVFRSPPTNLDKMIHLKEACVLDSVGGPFNLIWEAIRDWNLDQKLFSLTSVGEIRNNEHTSKLKNFLIRRKCLPVGGKLYTISCVDDVLNSIVSDEQPVLHLVGDILERFFEVHLSSSLTQQQLIEVVIQMELECPWDDAKQWYKIYFGLEVLLHFRKAFPSEELLSAGDSKTVESVWKILRAFYHAVEVTSGPLCPTSNIYFNVLWIVRTTLQEEASTDHLGLASMVGEMQKSFNEYWQNSYVWLSIPVVLDPRFKIAFIEFRLKQTFGSDAVKYVSVVYDTIRELFLEYCSPLDKTSVDTSNCEAHDVQVGPFSSDSFQDWDQHLNARTGSRVLKELNRYLEDDLVLSENDFDILKWWMGNSTKYPTLSIMARDVLAMPASAVHCEAALSSKGPVVHKQWSILNIKTTEALVCTRDWIK